MLESVTTQPRPLLPLVRHLSAPITPVLARLNINPNAVTSVALIIGLVAAWSFSFGSASGDWCGAILLLMSYVLDNCDGELARLTAQATHFGRVYDTVVDWLVHSALFVGLGVGTSTALAEPLWFWLGIAAALGGSINSAFAISRDLRDTSHEPSVVDDSQHADGQAHANVEILGQTPANLKEMFIYLFRELARADFCFLILLLAGLNLLWLILPMAALGAQIYWLTGLLRSAQGFHV